MSLFVLLSIVILQLYVAKLYFRIKKDFGFSMGSIMVQFEDSLSPTMIRESGHKFDYFIGLQSLPFRFFAPKFPPLHLEHIRFFLCHVNR